jgi:hypothetical protein
MLDNAEVMLALDIGYHAGKEAAAKIVDIIDTLPERQRLAALAVAFGYMQFKTDGIKVIMADRNPMLVLAIEGIAESLKRTGRIDEFRKEMEKGFSHD